MQLQVDQDRISQAIRETELKTSAEIVCVLARSSHDYATLPLMWATVFGLLAPWVLIATTQMTIERILLAQAIVFGALMLVLSYPQLRVKLAPRAMRRAHAHRAAMEQFMVRGLARTRDRRGVLIFVSLAEHYVRIVADDGVAERIGQPDWQGTVDAMIAHLRKGDVTEGFLDAINRTGDLLAAHFPPEAGDAQVLPDRIYVI